MAKTVMALGAGVHRKPGEAGVRLPPVLQWNWRREKASGRWQLRWFLFIGYYVLVSPSIKDHAGPQDEPATNPILTELPVMTRFAAGQEFIVHKQL